MILRKHFLTLVLACVSILTAPASQAGVSITTPIGSGAWSIVENQIVNNQRQITIYAAPEIYREFYITATSGTEKIRYIRIESDNTISGLTSSVGLYVVEDGGTFSHIKEISKDSGSTGELWVSSVDISGTIGEPGTAESGSVAADLVTRLRASGDLNASVTAGPRSGGGTSSLVQLRVDGDLRGDVDFLYGAIDEITVGGDIGSKTNTVTIRARDGIKAMTADAVWANIDADTDSTGNGSFRALTTSVGGFAGSLMAKRLESPTSGDGLYIAGDLSADLTLPLGIRLPIEIDGDLTGSIDASEILVGATIGSITVDGSLTGSVTLDASGLDGQIVVNAGNGTGDWTGPVTVGSIILDDGSAQPDEAPSYDRASADLGGGAIGLVPFNLHGADSSLADGAVVLNTHFLTQARIRHYGPITVDQTGGLAVKIERRTSYYPNNNTSSWSDVSSSWATSDVTVSGRDLLIAGVSGQFDCGYEYRITRIAGRVECDIASPVDVTAWTYLFEIPYCPWP